MKKNNKINLKLVFNILFYFKAWLGLNNLYSLFYKYLIYKNNIYLISYVCTFLFFSITNFKFIFKKAFNTYIFNIYIFLKQLFRYNRYYFLKDLIFIFFISSLYGIKDLFNNFILWNLNWREKTHYIFLNNLLKILIEFYRSNISFSKGFLCIVKGKINGISRKRTFKINLGSFGLQYFNLNIIYSSTYQPTRFGVLGIKPYLPIIFRAILWFITNRYTYTIEFSNFIDIQEFNNFIDIQLLYGDLVRRGSFINRYKSVYNEISLLYQDSPESILRNISNKFHYFDSPESSSSESGYIGPSSSESGFTGPESEFEDVGYSTGWTPICLRPSRIILNAAAGKSVYLDSPESFEDVPAVWSYNLFKNH
jgi:hypothetical protein